MMPALRNQSNNMGTDFLVEVNIKARCSWTAKKIKEIVKLIARLSKVNEGAVEINFVSPNEIKEINRRRRGKDEVTDVLSFAYSEMPPIQGEIVICLAQARRQAKFYRRHLNDEMKLLFVHGCLHLVGYDHIKPRERATMKALECKVLGMNQTKGAWL